MMIEIAMTSFPRIRKFDAPSPMTIRRIEQREPSPPPPLLIERLKAMAFPLED